MLTIAFKSKPSLKFRRSEKYNIRLTPKDLPKEFNFCLKNEIVKIDFSGVNLIEGTTSIDVIQKFNFVPRL